MKPLVFTWGNPARGDDGVGPWFADWLRHQPGLHATLVEDYQLQIEHILDLCDGDLLLFIDATCVPAPTPCFEQIQPTTDVAHTSHALTPAELLGYYERVFDTAAPAAFQLTISGSDFELGHGMSAATEACCRRASGLVAQLLARPSLVHWRALSRAQPERAHA